MQVVIDALLGMEPDSGIPANSIVGGMVEPPEQAGVIDAWNNDDWIDAMLRYADDGSRIDETYRFVGGRSQMVQQLSEAAKREPARFCAMAAEVAQRAHPDYLFGLVRGLATADLREVDIDSLLVVIGDVDVVDVDAVAWFGRRAAESGHATALLRSTLAALAGTRSEPTISLPDDDERDDVIWLNRADTSALAGLVALLARDPLSEANLAALVQAACEEGDIPRLLAIMWGLAVWTTSRPEVAQRTAATILMTQPAVAASQASRRLTTTPFWPRVAGRHGRLESRPRHHRWRGSDRGRGVVVGASPQ